MMLLQIFLPLYDNAGRPQPQSVFATTRDELTAAFGGLTAYTRAPAQGLWEAPSGTTTRDDLVIYEVLCPGADAAWWRAYRSTLEQRFRQETVLVRGQEVHVY
jgi:hypothetical protein